MIDACLAAMSPARVPKRVDPYSIAVAISDIRRWKTLLASKSLYDAEEEVVRLAIRNRERWLLRACT